MRDQVALPTYIDWMVHRFRVNTELALQDSRNPRESSETKA